jgi:hypothetical protein
MNKIAVFYMIGQFDNPRWKEDFFDSQMKLLRESGLYDQIQFIDIYVKSNVDTKDMTHIPTSDLPDKTNNLKYLGDLEEKRPYNGKLYRAYRQILQDIWIFSAGNPDYKILFYHSIGVTRNINGEDMIRRKDKWRKYMETLLIKNWKQSVELLDYYDCVGTEYIPKARFQNVENPIDAPHYQGFFWWANASYLIKLNPLYFYDPVSWQSYLSEFWIGSGNPKAFNYHNTWLNQYLHDVNPPYGRIINITENHLRELRESQGNLIDGASQWLKVLNSV